MPSVIYSMNVSLDGYIVGPDGGFGWTEPAEQVFRLHTDEVRGLRAYVMGRRLYETMLYWETVDQNPSLRPIVCPVLVGGGVPFHPQRERQLDLDLIESRTFDSGHVALRYRVVRSSRPTPTAQR